MLCKNVTHIDIINYLNHYNYKIVLCDDILTTIQPIFHALRILVISDQIDKKQHKYFNRYDEGRFERMFTKLLCIAKGGQCTIEYFETLDDMKNMSVEYIKAIFKKMIMSKYRNITHHKFGLVLNTFSLCADVFSTFQIYDDKIINALSEFPKQRLLKTDINNGGKNTLQKTLQNYDDALVEAVENPRNNVFQ